MPTSMTTQAIVDDADDIASPCISICKMDPRLGDADARAQGGLCVGCLRTIDEIIAWGRASAASKRAMLDAIEARRITIEPGP